MPGAPLVALLRAINVGGRTVRMERLREIFTGMGFSGVETFIASGNVIFESTEPGGTALEAKIEQGLRTALGFEVTTFIRTPAELARIVASDVFAANELAVPTASLYVGFLRSTPGAEAAAKLDALRTTSDDLRLRERELYWLARTKMSESKLSSAALERALGMAMTMRNITTVRKLAAKYAGE